MIKKDKNCFCQAISMLDEASVDFCPFYRIPEEKYADRSHYRDKQGRVSQLKLIK